MLVAEQEICSGKKVDESPLYQDQVPFWTKMMMASSFRYIPEVADLALFGFPGNCYLCRNPAAGQQ